MAYLEARNLTKIFGPRPAGALAQLNNGASKEELLAETGHTVGLHRVSISVEKGEIYVVMGLSGSGKSTLIRHLNRLIDPDEGEIVIDGEDILAMSLGELGQLRREKMSMVFQRFALMPHRTVLDNVAYGLEVRRVPLGERRKRAEEWVETVGLGGFGHQYPSQLSGGMQQRVGLARALCTDPEILLMDEAFSALDPLIRNQMQEELLSIQARLHKTIVFISHDLDEALRLGDRIAILKDGELVQVGTPAEILLAPADAYVRAFVRDVNRSRVLKIRNLMAPVPLLLGDAPLGQALEAMREAGIEVGYIADGNGYRGALVHSEIADGVGSDQPLGAHLIRLPAVASEAVLVDTLRETLSSRYPLPVVDENGALVGVIARERVVDALMPDEATGDA